MDKEIQFAIKNHRFRTGLSEYIILIIANLIILGVFVIGIGFLLFGMDYNHRLFGLVFFLPW